MTQPIRPLSAPPAPIAMPQLLNPASIHSEPSTMLAATLQRLSSIPAHPDQVPVLPQKKTPSQRAKKRKPISTSIEHTQDSAHSYSSLQQSAAVNSPEKQKEWVIQSPENSHPTYEHLHFTGPAPGLNDCEKPPMTPKGVFDMFLTDEIINSIVEKSYLYQLSERFRFGTEKEASRHRQRVNGYANTDSESGESSNEDEDARPKKGRRVIEKVCPKITEEELRRIIVILLLSAVHNKGSYKSLWSTNPFEATPIFKHKMPRDHFLELMSFLHFADDKNVSDNDSRDRFHKAQGIFELFNQ
jgi:hypothetical protein